MPIIFDGTLGITSPGGDTSNTSHSTPIVRSPSALTLQTNGSTTAMTIDTSQNVLIGAELTSGSSKLMVSNTLNFTHINNGNSTVNGSVPWLATFNNANASSATFGWAFYDSNADGSLHLYKRNSSTTGDLVMRMDRNNGAVTMPSQPSFSAYTDIQRNFNSGAFTPYIFELTRYNIGNHYNTSNGIFTAPVAGRYYFNCWIHWMQESSFNYMFVQPTVNGSPAFEFMRQGDRTDYSTFGGSMILNLSANDQVRMDVVTNGVDSGYARPGSSMNLFEGRLLG